MHYMNGLNPSRIQATMRIDHGITIPRTTIMNWIINVQDKLRSLLASTKVPLSGHWHHDETFLKVRGKKAYSLNTIDAETGFVPGVTISMVNDRSAAHKHFSSIPRDKRTQILSLVMDGTAKIGTMLKTRTFKKTQRGQCTMHLKWRVGRKLKRLAGLGESSKKALPEYLWGFRQRFYDVFDSHDETGAYFALERLRPVVQKVNKSYITKLFQDIEAKLPQIIAWQRNPAIAKTNNRCENFNQVLQYHVSFKSRSMSQKGAQRIGDFRVFKHNFGQFPKYSNMLQKKWGTYKSLIHDGPWDPALSGGSNYFTGAIRRLNKAYDAYIAFWDQYLKI